MLNSSVPAAVVCVSLIDITCCTGLVSSRGCNVTSSLQLKTLSFSLYSHSSYRELNIESLYRNISNIIYGKVPAFAARRSVSSLFLVEHSPPQFIDFTLWSRKWTVNQNNKAPAHSRFSLALVPARLAFDALIGWRAVTYSLWQRSSTGGPRRYCRGVVKFLVD